MRKKFFAGLFLTFVLILTGCQQDQEVNQNPGSSSSANEDELSVTIELVNVEDETVAEETFVIEEGQNLMEVAKENFDVTEKDGFITGIDELVADETKQEFVSISVNGEMAMVGANELVLEDEDEVTFSIEVWE